MPAALADALALLAGQPVTPTPDLAAKKTQLRQEIAVLDRGLAVAEQRLDETTARLTEEVALTLVEHHRGQLRAIYEAAEQLAAAMQAERQTISDFLVAGYGDASAILLRPGPSAAGRLGTLDEHDSELSFYRRRLVDLGVLS